MRGWETILGMHGILLTLCILCRVRIVFLCFVPSVFLLTAIVSIHVLENTSYEQGSEFLCIVGSFVFCLVSCYSKNLSGGCVWYLYFVWSVSMFMFTVDDVSSGELGWSSHCSVFLYPGLKSRYIPFAVCLLCLQCDVWWFWRGHLCMKKCSRSPLE